MEYNQVDNVYMKVSCNHILAIKEL